MSWGWSGTLLRSISVAGWFIPDPRRATGVYPRSQESSWGSNRRDTQSDPSRWLLTKKRFVLERMRCCKLVAFSDALQTLFLPRPLPEHVTCPRDSNVLYDLTGHVQCDCISGRGSRGPYVTYLSLQRWDIRTLCTERLQKFGEICVMFT